jgi:retron-type reverse transcriptase
VKRAGGLFKRIVSAENLIAAAYAAARGKRSKPNVIRFFSRLIDEVGQLRMELGDGSYCPGPYHEFFIYERKRRMISAAPFRDRVVHHALCAVIMPFFEAGFDDASFANRRGKGTHLAVRLCRRYLSRYPFYLKLDVRRYFPSIDHEILKATIRRKIKCVRTLGLIDAIIEGSNRQEEAIEYYPGDGLFTPFERRRGLPLGNLTSQYFANIHLTPLDRFIRTDLKIRAYIRYVDDLVLFHVDKTYLRECAARIGAYLARLRLKFHENRCHTRPSRSGITFLGYRVLPDRIRLARDGVIRARRRLRLRSELYHRGAISLSAYRSSVFGWLGHARQADAYRIAEEVLEMRSSCRSGVHPVSDTL